MMPIIQIMQIPVNRIEPELKCIYQTQIYDILRRRVKNRINMPVVSTVLKINFSTFQ